MTATTRAFVIAALAASVSPSRAEPAIDEVKLKGKDELKLKHDGAGWKISGPMGRARTLKKDGDAWLLVDEKKQMELRATCAADRSVHVTSKSGPVHDLVTSSDGFELFGPGHTLAFRVKVKGDKVNVYDSAAKRLGHGKTKEDGFVIRDAADAELWKVKGLATLQQLSYFTLPIDIGEVALLWQACP